LVRDFFVKKEVPPSFARFQLPSPSEKEDFADGCIDGPLAVSSVGFRKPFNRQRTRISASFFSMRSFSFVQSASPPPHPPAALAALRIFFPPPPARSLFGLRLQDRGLLFSRSYQTATPCSIFFLSNDTLIED